MQASLESADVEFGIEEGVFWGSADVHGETASLEGDTIEELQEKLSLALNTKIVLKPEEAITEPLSFSSPEQENAFNSIVEYLTESSQIEATPVNRMERTSNALVNRLEGTSATMQASG